MGFPGINFHEPGRKHVRPQTPGDENRRRRWKTTQRNRAWNRTNSQRIWSNFTDNFAGKSRNGSLFSARASTAPGNWYPFGSSGREREVPCFTERGVPVSWIFQRWLHENARLAVPRCSSIVYQFFVGSRILESSRITMVCVRCWKQDRFAADKTRTRAIYQLPAHPIISLLTTLLVFDSLNDDNSCLKESTVGSVVFQDSTETLSSSIKFENWSMCIIAISHEKESWLEKGKGLFAEGNRFRGEELISSKELRGELPRRPTRKRRDENIKPKRQINQPRW